MKAYLGEVLISRDEIKKKVKELAAMISKDYEGKDPIFIGVLKGAIIFMADLLRSIPYSVFVDFMAVSSYGDATETSGIVKIDK
ncbi:MAG: hypoxanthine phosphoribosyltransferase, partial [Chloroflexi bacterium]|nr:hypoxanthine phosphoribosyltransferase [Chloroflexota bacterium]